MTIDERSERIGHVTAGWAEQFRREREEKRQLWRETQRQIAETTAAVTRLAEETQRKIDNLALADRRVGERIESLVLAISKVLDRLPGA